MSPDGLQQRYAWIAVALATAIRLFAGSWIATPGVIAAMAIAVMFSPAIASLAPRCRFSHHRLAD